MLMDRCPSWYKPADVAGLVLSLSTGTALLCLYQAYTHSVSHLYSAIGVCVCRFDTTMSSRTTWSHRVCAVWRQRQRRSRSRDPSVHCQLLSHGGRLTLPRRRCSLHQHTRHRQWHSSSSWRRRLWDCPLPAWAEAFRWLLACLLEWWACYHTSLRFDLAFSDLLDHQKSSVSVNIAYDDSSVCICPLIVYYSTENTYLIQFFTKYPLWMLTWRRCKIFARLCCSVPFNLILLIQVMQQKCFWFTFTFLNHSHLGE